MSPGLGFVVGLVAIAAYKIARRMIGRRPSSLRPLPSQPNTPPDDRDTERNQQ